MSHQTPVGTSSSSSSSSGQRINRLKISRGLLTYAQKGSKEFQKLASVSGNSDHNVFQLEFSYRLHFRQTLLGNRCMVTYLPGTFSDPKLDNVGVGEFDLSFTVTGSPVCDFSGDEAQAKDLPLAKHFALFSRVNLRLAWREFTPPSSDQQACRQLLSHLTSGSVTQLPECSENAFMEQMTKVSIAETAAQEKLVGKQQDCSMKTKIWYKTIVVEVFLKPNEANADLDVGTNHFGNRYTIKDCITFPEKAVGDHKYPGQESKRWEFCVVDRLPGFAAPIVGIMQNRFKQGEDIAAYSGKTDKGVTIEPIFDDILGDRSREALSDFGKDLNALSAEALGSLAPTLTTAMLPMRAMFLKGMPYVASDNEVPGPHAPAPTAWRGNDSQKEALRKAFAYKVSLVWGPAATGKSEVLANIIVQAIHRDPRERILVNASRNVPLNSLMQRAIQVWKNNNPNVDPPFVRLFSASQIQAQYAVKAPTLQDECHIDKLRLQEAARQPRQYSVFLENHKEMMAQGFIEDEKKSKKYFKDASELTKVVMDRAKAVFCTTAACRNRALRWTVNVDDEKKAETWPATMNVVDEAACANPLELLLPLATFNTIRRVTYGGDHKQLRLFLVSEEAKKLWAKTLFEELYVRKWPTTLLNVQYRTHSDAAEAANHVIYDDKVLAYYKTDVNSRPFYMNLSRSLPISFTANDLEYKLTTYLNFVDVQNGVEEGPAKGSRRNLQEVKVIIGMLKSFLNFGRIGSHIAVVTAYTMQFAQIQKEIRVMHAAEPAKGWNQVHLLTANTVQAEEYNIVILSLVKTKGHRGFIGEKERANVVCTRHREAMYFVGKWDFWVSHNPIAQNTWLDKIIYRMRDTCWKRPPFRVKNTCAGSRAESP